MKKVATIIAEKKGKRGGCMDEAAAFSVYCEKRPDGKLNSYADVAKKVGFSTVTVEKAGKKGDWANRRAELGEKAISQTIMTLGEQMKAKNIEHMKEFVELARKGKRILDAQMVLFEEMMLDGTEKMKKPRKAKFSSFATSIAQSMVIEGIKGQRVTLGLPTDVTKSMAVNLNFTEELPKEELEQMQQFLDANYNKKQIGNGSNTDTKQ